MSDANYKVVRKVKYGENDWRDSEVLRSGLEHGDAQDLAMLLNQENKMETRNYFVAADTYEDEKEEAQQSGKVFDEGRHEQV